MAEYEKISEDFEIVRFDGVDIATVYAGGFDSLVYAPLKWRRYEHEIFGEVEALKLSEIVEQLEGKTRLITLFLDSPMHSEVWQCGNYNDGEWWRIATGMGYA